MVKYTSIVLTLVSALSLNSQAGDVATARQRIVGVAGELSSLMSGSRQKSLPLLIDEVHALMERETPELLRSLEPLSEEERMGLLVSLGASPEFARLSEALAELRQSKAAETLLPMVQNGSPAYAVQVLPYATKMKLIDIVAALAKVTVGLGGDRLAAVMYGAARCSEEKR